MGKGSALGSLIVLAIFFKYIGWFVLICAMVAFVYLWYVFAKWYVARLDRKADEKAEAVARAEAENREWLRAGIYEGAYPAHTMPLYSEARDWYDYDDGLTDWR